MKTLDSKIKKQLDGHGISFAQFEQQLKTFQDGIPAVELQKAATPEDGISVFNDTEQERFLNYFEENLPEKILKFIPASGAATRMFKDLQSFVNDFEQTDRNIDESEYEKKHPKVKLFFDELEHLAIYKDVKHHIERSEAKTEAQKYYELAKVLLDENSLNYADFPKGLVPFHRYGGEVRTAFEEHFQEGGLYAAAINKLHCHFTIAKDHLPKFQQAYDVLLKKYGQKPDQLKADFSFQKKSTDTLAVDLNNNPVYQSDELLLRPGGHGALIENLNTVEADLVYIKNIDNVIVRHKMPAMAEYKKMLAGLMLNVQNEIFSILKALDKDGFTEELLKKSNELVQDEIGLKKELKTEADVRDYLNRPIRVCGMVKNEGDPGGGPFWIKDGHGDISLQIVESAQINSEDAHQKEIISEATHFNPVDLVCGLKNYQGEKFDLMKFVNDKRGFITEKSKNGQKIKVLELPGLWNGAMEYWNTIFVEVPYFTFNPVKSIVELLKENHRGV